MTNLCSLYLKQVSMTAFMHSYRIPPYNSGFGNIEPSYGHFKPFGEVKALFRFLAIMYYKVHDQFV